jgi:NodT family efflux transporter outer membrane factor (OMF) lipoprotein
VYCILLLFLSACISVPRSGDRLQREISFKETESALLEGSFFEKGEWPAREWWELFADRQLSRLVSLAIQNNPSLERAEAKLKEAHASAQRERAFLFPEIDATATSNWEHYSKNGLYRGLFPTFPAIVNTIDLNLNFFYEFDFWNKRRNHYRAALGRERAEAAEWAEAEIVLSVAVVQSYCTLQAYLEKWEVQRELLHHEEALFGLKRTQERRSLATHLEVLAAERRLLEARFFLLNVEKEIEIEGHRLQTLIGEASDAPPSVTRSRVLFEHPFPLPETLSVELVARRPDLMAQIWRVEAQAYEIGAAKADFFPNINLMAIAGLESLHFNTLLTGASKDLSLVPALSLPIFTAGRIRANLRAQKALFDEMIALYHEMLLRAVQEVGDQVVLVKSLSLQLEVREEILNAALSSSSLSSSRYTIGVTDYEEALNAEINSLQERLTLIDIYYGRLSALVGLIRALGGGYSA